jgi:hypothetical protein
VPRVMHVVGHSVPGHRWQLDYKLVAVIKHHSCVSACAAMLSVYTHLVRCCVCDILTPGVNGHPVNLLCPWVCHVGPDLRVN